MSESEPPEIMTRPKMMRNVGIALFLLSFVVPRGGSGSDALSPFAGFWVFVQTPEAITFLPLFRGPPIDDGFTPYEIFIRVILLSAWLTNFTVFFRLPILAALIAIVLPWTAFVCWFALAVSFLPFYFWAMGVTLVHFSRTLKPAAKIGMAEIGVA